MTAAVKILYLHGFRSSPLSMKGRLLGERMAQLGRAADYLAPQLPASPQLAMQQAMALVAGLPRDQVANELAIVGSSLGGYYATWMAEQLGCRAALLNPAVTPLRDLEKYVGMTTMFHSGEPFEFKREYIAELGELAVPAITRPERYYLLAATGDEVLDWRDMVAHYPGARQHVIDGSDHGIAEFADYVDEVLAFCGIGAG
ncbi:esterase [Pseudoduganella sp. SL102]|uniref:YqiA/YcfP family alpha/beta fold hydrolase n=1 Tax=Pseudoduganella sp. SL102 TaxID=2995154 RepID=UPI00248BB796|nr:YqiA/YcfP family alpha/beta fold hydrolase [Pseudoduganella sp. SL102]WBS02220.1 esterase [Pseudoduganella sp. SL102]